MTRTTERLKERSRQLKPLQKGNKVFIQNQSGPHPNKWDRSGTIVEVKPHDQYTVKVDGSGRLTLRNRRFLRGFTPFTERIGFDRQHCGKYDDPCQHDASQPEDKGVAPQLDHNENEKQAPEHPPAEEFPKPPVTDTHTPEPTSEGTSRGSPDQPTEGRPQRVRHPPKQYEPESGNWI